MSSGKLSLRKVKTVLVLVGSALFMASFLVACGDLEGPPLNPRDAPIHLADAPTLAWTQDGEHILFSIGGTLGVYVVDSAGLSARSFPETAPRFGTFRQPGAFAPALSPDGSRIAYSVWVPQNNTAVETAAFDGSDVRRLTAVEEPFGIDNLHPDWSPDGGQLAFIGGGRFSVMDADGTNVRALAPSVDLDPAPSKYWSRWSPDGTWLAFLGYELDEEGLKVYGLYTVRPDGSGLTLIANTMVADMSPDGSLLAFVAEQTDAEGIPYLALQTARPDGTDLITVSELVETHVNSLRPNYSLYGTRRIYQPVWSPDGAWLAFVDDRGAITDSRDRSIIVTRPDGSDLKAVIMVHRFAGFNDVDSRTATETNGPGVFWTPDGEEIWTRDLAFAVRPDGSGLREVIPGGIPNVVRAAWSPDGSQLAVLTIGEGRQFKLLVVDRNGGEARELVRGALRRMGLIHGGVASIPEWQDTSRDYTACSAGYVVPEPEENPGLVQDCQTLITLRNALAGEAYLNWGRAHQIGLPSSIESNWHMVWNGVTVGGDPPRVQRLSLSAGGINAATLTGVIPPELGNLTGLEHLNLTGNSLTGEIPPELGNLTRLRHLGLNQNSLSGSVPPELGKLSNLESLYLFGNNLSGCIPVALSESVTELRTDDLAYCE